MIKYRSTIKTIERTYDRDGNDSFTYTKYIEADILEELKILNKEFIKNTDYVSRGDFGLVMSSKNSYVEKIEKLTYKEKVVKRNILVNTETII